jgi:hypothetical protein
MMDTMMQRGTLVLSLTLMVPPVLAQDATTLRVAVVPWVDATGTGSRGSNVAVSQVLIDELAAGSRLIGVLVDPGAGAADGTVDQARAIALGKAQGTDLVFVGSVVEADSRESSRGGWLPKIKGSQVHLTVRSIEARMALQGALYDVSTGSRLLSVSARGSHKDRAYNGRVWSSWGSWDVGDHGAFMASPLGRAFLAATKDLVKQLTEGLEKRVSAQEVVR